MVFIMVYRDSAVPSLKKTGSHGNEEATHTQAELGFQTVCALQVSASLLVKSRHDGPNPWGSPYWGYTHEGA